MRMSGTQLSVSQGGAGGVTTLLDLSDDTEIGEPEKTTAAAAFLGCVSTSAKTDKRLGYYYAFSLQDNCKTPASRVQLHFVHVVIYETGSSSSRETAIRGSSRN